MACEQRLDAVVVVLVDDEHAGTRGAPASRASPTARPGRPSGRPSRRRGRSGPRKRRAATGAGYPHPPWPFSTPRLRHPRRPQRGGDDRRGGAERAWPDALRPRAGRRRRRLGRRHAATSSRRSTTRALRVIRNEAPLGLAGALNVGLDGRARGVRRADGRRRRRAAALARAARGAVRAAPRVAVVGTGMIDLARRRATRHGASHADRRARGPLGRALLVAVLPLDRRSSTGPFSTRTGSATTRRSARARTSTSGRGSSLLPMETTLRRHSSSTASTPAQASAGAPSSSVECQRRVALRQIAALAPELDARAAELAWRAGAGRPVPARRGGRGGGGAREARRGVRAAPRRPRGATGGRVGARPARGEATRGTRSRCARLDPALPLQAARRARPAPGGGARAGRRGCVARGAGRRRPGAADDGLPGADAVPDARCSTVSPSGRSST